LFNDFLPLFLRSWIKRWKLSCTYIIIIISYLPGKPVLLCILYKTWKAYNNCKPFFVGKFKR
jgi:hypothetical protein